MRMLARPTTRTRSPAWRLTNPDKLLYPEARLAKRDLARYYVAVGEWMLPHVRGRPLSLVRCPNGWDKKCFYQKNADDSVHAAISRVIIDNGDGGHSTYMMAESVPALVALVQMGVLEIHPWGSQSGRLGLPDRLVFDLDPEESLPWENVTQAVLVVKTLMENLGLTPFLKSTGGKGLHVVVPIEPSVGWEDVKGFTKAVAELLERTFPDRFTAKLLKISRRGRIFIDYLRNAEGATAVAAYSLRAKANAPVSTPIHWDELAKDVRFAHFNVLTVPKRLAKLKNDPWRGIGERAVSLTPALMARVGYKPALTKRRTGDAVVGRNERVFVQGVARAFLSGEAARQRDAALLRRALHDGRDQQHVLPHAGRVDARAMVAAGSRSVHVHAEGAEAHHARPAACAKASRVSPNSSAARTSLETSSASSCSSCRRT